jgi:hypothetical protein
VLASPLRGLLVNSATKRPQAIAVESGPKARNNNKNKSNNAGVSHSIHSVSSSIHSGEYHTLKMATDISTPEEGGVREATMRD